MPSNVENPVSVPYTSLATHDYVVAAGGAGWVDVDASAEIGTAAPERIYVFVVESATSNAGVRPAGSAVACDAYCNNTATLLSKAVAGHFEMLRGAADKHYRLVGYLL